MTEVFVPVMGMAPDEVILVAWLKQPGDPVAVGEAVAVVETSKANLEIQSESAGVLGRHLFEEDALLAPGKALAYVLAEGELDPGESAPPGGDPAAGALTDSGVQVLIDGAEGSPTLDGTAAGAPRHTRSPRQRRLATEQPAPAAAVPPPAAQPAAVEPVAVEPVTVQPAAERGAGGADRRFREAISASVTRSWQEIPHFTVTRELRVGAAVQAVRQWRAVLPGLTLTDLLLRALALSLLEHIGSSDLDLGLAVATDRGVAIPVIRSVPRLGLVELRDARRAAVDRARDGRLHPDDGRVPASTLSNLGALDVDQFTGVIPYGQTCMVSVGRAAERPVVQDGELAVATTMQATLNVDHRSWDGYHAGQLLQRLAAVLDQPSAFLTSSGRNQQSSTEESR